MPIETELVLTLDEAVGGCRKTIHVHGKDFDLNVPPGLKGGTRLRLKGAHNGRDVEVVLKIPAHRQGPAAEGVKGSPALSFRAARRDTISPSR